MLITLNQLSSFAVSFNQKVIVNQANKSRKWKKMWKITKYTSISKLTSIVADSDVLLVIMQIEAKNTQMDKKEINTIKAKYINSEAQILEFWNQKYSFE